MKKTFCNWISKNFCQFDEDVPKSHGDVPKYQYHLGIKSMGMALRLDLTESEAIEIAVKIAGQFSSLGEFMGKFMEKVRIEKD